MYARMDEYLHICSIVCCLVCVINSNYAIIWFQLFANKLLAVDCIFWAGKITKLYEHKLIKMWNYIHLHIDDYNQSADLLVWRRKILKSLQFGAEVVCIVHRIRWLFIIIIDMHRTTNCLLIFRGLPIDSIIFIYRWIENVMRTMHIFISAVQVQSRKKSTAAWNDSSAESKKSKNSSSETANKSRLVFVSLEKPCRCCCRRRAEIVKCDFNERRSLKEKWAKPNEIVSERPSERQSERERDRVREEKITIISMHI